MALNITKIDGVAIADIAKWNGVTVDPTPVTGEVREINGVHIEDVDVPTGLIIPYTGGAGGAPTGWTIFNSADGYHIVGAGSTYAVAATGAGSGNVSVTTDTAGAHGDSSPIANVATNGGRYRWYSGNPDRGGHTNTFTFTYTPPYQQCYLIKANAGQSDIPAGGVLWTYDRQPTGFTNIWTDGYMFKAAAGVGTGGSDTNNSVVSTSAGGHQHGFADSGDSSGSTASQTSGAHTHTENFSTTNGLYLRAMAAWQDAVSAQEMGAWGNKVIGLYENTTPPAGWYLCDGTNGTPDLRDYYVKNVAYASAGSGSGDGTITVVGDGTLAHGTHNHNDPNDDGGSGGTAYHSDNITMGSHAQISDNQSWTPPYYALAFIMKA